MYTYSINKIAMKQKKNIEENLINSNKYNTPPIQNMRMGAEYYT